MRYPASKAGRSRRVAPSPERSSADAPLRRRASGSRRLRPRYSAPLRSARRNARRVGSDRHARRLRRVRVAHCLCGSAQPPTKRRLFIAISGHPFGDVPISLGAPGAEQCGRGSALSSKGSPSSPRRVPADEAAGPRVPPRRRSALSSVGRAGACIAPAGGGRAPPAPLRWSSRCPPLRLGSARPPPASARGRCSGLR